MRLKKEKNLELTLIRGCGAGIGDVYSLEESSDW